jgi:hypothetical protein
MDEQLVSQGQTLIKLFEQAEVDLTEYRRDRTEAKSVDLDNLIERISTIWIELMKAGEADPILKPRIPNAAIILRFSIDELREDKVKADQGIDEDKEAFRARHMYKGCRALVSRVREELVYLVSEPKKC